MKDAIAIVIGLGINGLGLIRNLGRSGVKVVALADGKNYAAKSRYCSKLIIKDGVSSDPDMLAGVLEEIRTENPDGALCVFPSSDKSLTALAEIKERVQNLHVNIPDKKALDLFIDKWSFYSLLEELHIPYPKTDIVGKNARAENFSDYDFPLFLKPQQSHLFREKFQGLKGFTVDNAPELDKHLDICRENNLEMMITEIVPGFSELHYFIDGYVDKHGALAALFARRRLHMYPPRWGNSTSMVSIPQEEIKPAVSNLKKLLEHTHYRGIFSLEVKYDAGKDKYKFIELNARSWWYNLFPASCSINIIELALKDLLQDKIDPFTTYKTGVKHIYWWPEVKARFENFRQKEKGLFHFLGAFKPSYNTPIFAFDDPLPFLKRLHEYICQQFRDRVPGHE